MVLWTLLHTRKMGISFDWVVFFLALISSLAFWTLSSVLRFAMRCEASSRKVVLLESSLSVANIVFGVFHVDISEADDATNGVFEDLGDS